MKEHKATLTELTLGKKYEEVRLAKGYGNSDDLAKFYGVSIEGVWVYPA